MKRINKIELLKDYEKVNIPEQIGVFTLLHKNQLIFIKTTANLKRFIHLYTDGKHVDNGVKDLYSRFDELCYITCDSLIEAYIIELLIVNTGEFYDFKVAVHGNIPEFNNKIKAWYNYLYLSIDFFKPIYLKQVSDTAGNDIYLGPFRSSFTLNDALDSFADIFKLPRCEDEDFPCSRLDNNKCLGFCQNKLSEALPDMINKMMLVPNREVIQKLTAQRESLLNELKFIEADTLIEQIKLIKLYYKNILFLYVSQFINGEYKLNLRDGKLFCRLVICDGMIKELITEDKNNIRMNQYLNIYESDLSIRRTNELLAYDKSEYDHRWIVFSYLYDTEPDIIEAILIENIADIQKELFKNIKSEK